MRIFKTLGRIVLVILSLICFLLVTMFYEGYKRKRSIIKANNDISIWHRQRDELYEIEELSFSGKVISLSPGLHRHDVDTVTVKLASWNSFDSLFTGTNYLNKNTDSTVLLFIIYSESIWDKKIVIGDYIKKSKYSYDFSIYNSNQDFKKKLSLFNCFYGTPDTIVQNGNFTYALHGKTDTLYEGFLIDSMRNGSWKYFEPYYSQHYKTFEGQYLNDKRNGTFRKFYELSNQLIYLENYAGNLPNGEFIWWYANGHVESKKYFQMGKPTGRWEFYDKKGKLIKVENHFQ
jgi:antitoxin component YwqK of YwqJK toxin-antitoxin module